MVCASLLVTAGCGDTTAGRAEVGQSGQALITSNQCSARFKVVSSTAKYDGQSRDALVSMIDASQTLCSTELTSLVFYGGPQSCGTGFRDLGFHLKVRLTVSPAEAGAWSFRLGPDYGWGGALFVDGVLLDDSRDDLWWSRNFANTGELLEGTVDLAAGVHIIETIGFEPCCAGPATLQYRSAKDPDFANFSCDLDSDQDGVSNPSDKCPGTPAGELVNADGCAISQLCSATAEWRNHGLYVSCVAHAVNDFRRAGLLTGEQGSDIVSAAAQSEVGK